MRKKKRTKKNSSFLLKTISKNLLDLKTKDRLLFGVFFSLFLFGAILLVIDFYFKNTAIVPAPGGTLKEGVVGQPQFINPIYAQTDVDRDLVNLVFSGLMKYGKDGQIEPDLIKDYQIENQGRVYIITLKKSVFFHDGQPLTADDVIFTIQSIQNPDLKSPLLAKWYGVEIEKLSDYQIKFTLKNPYPAFLENLTLKILPAHIWKNVSPQNFLFSPYNLSPIGSGPYKFKSLSKNPDGSIKSIILEKNKNYYQRPPYIHQIEFFFFKNQKDLLKSAKLGQIDAFSPLLFFPEEKIDSFKIYHFIFPRYFALFLNSQKNEFLAQKEIRKALSLIVNREKILKEIFKGHGRIVESPFLPSVFHFNPPKIDNFNLTKAQELLKEAGLTQKENKWVKIQEAKTLHFTKTLTQGEKGKEVENLQRCLAMFEDIYPEGKITGYFGKKTKEAVIRFQEKYREEILKPAGLTKGNGRVGPATRKKLNEICIIEPEKIIPFKITITTANNPILVSLAEEIKKQFLAFGIETELEIFDISKIKQEIVPQRNYQAILFGQVLGLIPDPFPFWHSSQRKSPGLNLGDYQNKKLDQLLEKLRTTQEAEKRKEIFQSMQEIVLEEMPAIFICNPDYLYFVAEKIKGIEGGITFGPSGRFSQIQNWYLHTKRAFK